MTPKESCEKEIARGFKKFYKFCASSDSDDLKDLLAVLCSSFEKIETLTNVKFKDNHRFIAMKAFRNFSTHESELLNNSKALSINGTTRTFSDVQLLCLIPQNTLNYLLSNLRSDFTKKCINDTVVAYDEFVDIYPTLFNLIVDLYFLVDKHALTIDGAGFLSIAQAIKFEQENGYSHHIGGRIIMLDGSNVNTFLKESMIDISLSVAEHSTLPVDENGLFSGISAYERSPNEQVKLMNADDKEYILNSLINTKAISIRKDVSGKNIGYMNRVLHPIEMVIANEYLESL
jgi:hypothetical protein